MKLLGVKIPKKIIFVALLASFLAQAPNIYTWLDTPEGFWFSGFNTYFSPVDFNTYLASMRQGFNGNWLWQNRYTSETTSAYPFFIFYLLLGHFARLLHLSLPFVFHFSSFVLSTVFLLIVYSFIAHFLKEEKDRLYCFLLVSLGGGVGWGALQSSPDVLHREVTVFATLDLPHFVLDQLLFILTIYFGFLGVKNRDLGKTIISAVSGVLLSLIHPYSLVVAVVVLGGYTFLSGVLKRAFLTKLKYLSPLLFTSAAILLFFLYTIYLRGDPVLKEWMRQQVILSYHPLIMFLGYGLLSILALFGLRSLWEKRSEPALFFLSWFFLHFSIIYLPVPFQLLMIRGFFIVLCLLATLGIKKLTFLKTSSWALILFFSLLTTLVVVTLRISASRERCMLTYLTVEEAAAFSWVRQNIPTDSLFLSSYITGNFLPAQTNVRSFCGHNTLTTRFDQKEAVVRNFYGGKMGEEEMKRFLENEGIDYVFCGPGEKIDLNLEKVYENEKVKIFKVKAL